MSFPFCIPNIRGCRGWEFLLFYFLVNILHCQIFLFRHLKMYIMLSPCFFFLICNSLVTYDVQHCLIFLFAICIHSLVTCLFRSYSHFKKIELFVFLLLNFKVSLYISVTSLLSHICLANMFSHSLACLCIL